jgi:hypothetical protein
VVVVVVVVVIVKAVMGTIKGLGLAKHGGAMSDEMCADDILFTLDSGKPGHRV